MASHGTDGAQAAEAAALRLCGDGGRLHHLIVVPRLWKGMTGDDWLNNGITRDRFTRYLEEELAREVDEHLGRVQAAAQARALSYTYEVVFGEPHACLLNAADREEFDLVVIGSPRPKGTPGLRSRLEPSAVLGRLRVPLLVVPFPHGG